MADPNRPHHHGRVTEKSDQDARVRELQDELRHLLSQWDPIGVYDASSDCPPGEYDCLLGPLLTRLARHDSRADLSQYLWNEVEHHFGLDPVGSGTDTFAERLIAWYAAKNQGSS